VIHLQLVGRLFFRCDYALQTTSSARARVTLATPAGLYGAHRHAVEGGPFSVNVSACEALFSQTMIHHVLPFPVLQRVNSSHRVTSASDTPTDCRRPLPISDALPARLPDCAASKRPTNHHHHHHHLPTIDAHVVSTPCTSPLNLHLSSLLHARSRRFICLNRIISCCDSPASQNSMRPRIQSG
jgi:hypothetical protein